MIDRVYDLLSHTIIIAGDLARVRSALSSAVVLRHNTSTWGALILPMDVRTYIPPHPRAPTQPTQWEMCMIVFDK